MKSLKSQIVLAVQAFKNGDFTSIRACAKAYNVPHTTIYHRIKKGGESHQTAHKSTQKLDIHQEEFLCNWIIEEYHQSRPPSHAIVREMAQLLLRSSGQPTDLDRNWMYSFISRNPHVKTMVGCSID